MQFDDLAEPLMALVGRPVAATVSTEDDKDENTVAMIYGALERAPDLLGDDFYLVLEAGGTGVFIRRKFFTRAALHGEEIVVQQGPTTISIKPR